MCVPGTDRWAATLNTAAISRVRFAHFTFSRPIAGGQATLFYNLASAPAHRIINRWRWTIRRQGIVVDVWHRGKNDIPRIAMPRHDFNQLHFLRPVFRLQMLVKCYPPACVPRCSMRNNKRIAFALPNINQRAWRFSNLETSRGQIGTGVSVCKTPGCFCKKRRISK